LFTRLLSLTLPLTLSLSLIHSLYFLSLSLVHSVTLTHSAPHPFTFTYSLTLLSLTFTYSLGYSQFLSHPLIYPLSHSYFYNQPILLYCTANRAEVSTSLAPLPHFVQLLGRGYRYIARPVAIHDTVDTDICHEYNSRDRFRPESAKITWRSSYSFANILYAISSFHSLAMANCKRPSIVGLPRAQMVCDGWKCK